MSYIDALDRITDDFGKHRLTDVMEEENEEEGRFSRNNIRKRISSNSSAILTEDTDSFIIGQKVWVSGNKPGHIAFIGETQFAPGEWAGIALDEPIGKNDGSVGGIRYFQCEPKKGVFARLTRLTRFPLAQEGMGSGDTYFSSSMDNGVRRSPVSPTGSTRGAFRSSTSIGGSNISLASAASHAIDYKIGDRVIIKSSQGSKVGTVRYIGTTEFANGEWVGVELDEPRGKNDGSVNGKRYFECHPNFGLFAPVAKVSKSPSKIKPNSCQVHSSSPGLPPSGILKRTNSKESMLSNLSMTSASSNVRRVRLGVTSLTPKKVTAKATSTPIPTRTALQDLLKEKQLHIEQLLKERDLERSEITKAANQAEEAEQRLAALRQEYVKYRAECEVQLEDHMKLLNKLKEDRIELVAQLDEEKRKTEDLTFRLAESSIFKEDLEKTITMERVANESNLKKIKELEEALQKERDKVENLESDANKLFEAEENLIKAKEEIDALRKQLLETQEKQIVLEGNNTSLQEQLTRVKSEYDDAELKFKEFDAEIKEKSNKLMEQKDLKINELEVLIQETTKQYSEVSNKFGELQKELEMKCSEIECLKTSNAALTRSSDELNAKVNELQKTTDAIKEKDLLIQSLQIELETTKLDRESITSNLAHYQTNMANVESTLKKECEEIKESFKTRIAELEEAKEIFSKNISEKDDGLKRQSVALSEKTSEVERLQTELETLKNEKVNDLEAKLSEFINKLDQKDKVIALKDDEIMKVTQELNNAKSYQNGLDHKVELTEEANESNLKKVKELEEALQKERDKIEKLESDANKLPEAQENLNKAKEEIDSLRKQMLETRDKQIVLEGENVVLQKDLERVKSECDHAKLKFEEFDAEAKGKFNNLIEQKDLKINTLDLIIQETTKENAEISNKFGELQKELETKSSELECLKTNNIALTKSSDELSAKVNELQKMTATIKDKDLLIQSLQTELETTKVERESISSNLAQYQTNMAKVESVLKKDAEEIKESLKNKVAELEETKEIFSKNISEKDNELKIQSTMLSEKTSEVERLKREFETLTNEKVNDLEAKLSEFISKLGQKDILIALKDEEIIKIKEELNNAKSHQNGLDHKMEPTEGQTNESPQYQQLLEEKIFAENQVTFLNSIIADMQRKNEEQQARIEILEMGYNAAAADELTSLGFNREAKIPTPRMYCDICEEFDLHETEDCPTQGDDVPLINRDLNKTLKEKAPPRAYCEICEVFGHATEECTNVDQEF